MLITSEDEDRDGPEQPCLAWWPRVASSTRDVAEPNGDVLGV